MDTKTYKHGLVPLSADPITLGHLDLITEARLVCDKVTVYVTDNDLKAGHYLFTREERTVIAAREIRNVDLVNVHIVSGNDLMVDVFLEHGCDALFRGVRDEKDRRYEEEQVRYHALLYPAIEDMVVYVTAKPELATVSSSLVKAFVMHGIDVSRFVPVGVKRDLEARLCGRSLIGVTGEIASGKSTVTRHMTEILNERGIGATHLDVDACVREALSHQGEGGVLLRSKIAELLGDEEIRVQTGSVLREHMRKRVFSPETSDDVRKELHALTEPYVLRAIRQRMRDLTGVVFFEWAQLVEMHMLPWVNNNLVVIHAPTRKQFAEERHVSDLMYNELRRVQLTCTEKANRAQRCIREDRCGTVIVVENEQGDARGVALHTLEQLVHTQMIPEYKEGECHAARVVHSYA